MKRPLAALIVLAAAGPAAAENDPKFEFGKRDELKDVDKTVWTATAEAGAVVTTGNSRTQSLTGGAKATRKEKKTKLSAEAAGNFERASSAVVADVDGNGVVSASEVTRVSKTSAESLQGKLRYDRFLTTWDALFAAGLAATDRIAGKQFYGGAQLGYARTLYKTEKHTVTVEGGYDFSYESYVASDSPGVAIHSARGFVGYEGKLGGDASLTGSLEALDNLNHNSEAERFRDLRVIGNVALSTKLTKSIALTFSVMAKFDDVPAPAALGALMADPADPPRSDKLDTTTKASLIITLL